MNIQLREIRGFFYSQYFSDGLRMCLGILIPALVLNYLNRFDLGVTLSLGALCVSVVDTPGPLVYKRNAMLASTLCVFLVAMATGFARLNTVTLGIGITIITFIFSMLAVYGTRAAAVGTGTLLVMVFMIEKATPPAQVLPYSLALTAGGVWYLFFSVLFFSIRPYRAAQQALGENIMDVVKFLRIKADFYLPHTDIDENYRKLVSQQIQVSQHQDGIRELLFRSRVMVKESTNASRVLVLIFIDLVDLYEQILATHYDYGEIRKRFGNTGILEEIARVLRQMAHELENIGYAVMSNRRYMHSHDFNAELEHLKLKIDAAASAETGTSNIVLKKILINLRDLNQNIHNIFSYYNSRSSKELIKKPEEVEYSKFVTRQDYAPHEYFDNLSFSSASFRHAVRVSMSCLIGFIASKMYLHGHHSYWVLLTIIVILKPGFSLSKQRNYQRLVGTIAGGIIGIVILKYIPNEKVQFILFITLMIGTYSFTRLNYIVAVIFMTPYVFLLFKFLGVTATSLVQERIIDTAVGSGIAFIAMYIILPRWEFEDVEAYLAGAIHANANYLAKIAETISGNTVSVTDYKLARKDIYVKSANLSAMFERMTSEPKSKQKKLKDIHKFVVLNHILSSYLANLSSAISAKQLDYAQQDNIRLIRKSIAVLNESNRKLGEQQVELICDKIPQNVTESKQLTASEALLKEQLGFVNKISYDIAKVTDSILA
ncbi:FUSC family membrane protein [Mucilaginibacter sp.]|uniref:FUSC family membrane protein n=1 Tax=Mucilaginibacter sp. TaxID=1882438 RepID=UPI002CDABB61|nr:FUSC family membrane protein [Mucilaginibacter sp.]HTI61565.1 FUSC family membrane protein [Mucilaginibacter sp.]